MDRLIIAADDDRLPHRRWLIEQFGRKKAHLILNMPLLLELAADLLLKHD